MVYAIILSGGTGTRVGGEIPKQYIEVGGKPIILYSIETLLSSEKIDGLCIVADPDWQKKIAEWVRQGAQSSCIADNSIEGMRNSNILFATPGLNRQLSIYNGLKTISQIAQDTDYVFIHDAARPMLSKEDIDYYTTSVIGHDGLIPVLPMKDTVYLSEDGKTITSLLDRKTVVAGQAPEMFILGKYLAANERLIATDNSPILKINGSTEPAIMAGMDIVTVPGDENNYKITTPNDLKRFEEYIKNK